MALRPNLFVTVYTNTLYTISTQYLHTVSGGQQQQYTRADEEEMEQKQER